MRSFKILAEMVVAHVGADGLSRCPVNADTDNLDRIDDAFDITILLLNNREIPGFKVVPSI